MIFSKLKPILLLLSSAFLISCDSSPVPFGGDQLTDRTESDITVTDGEIFRLTNVVFPENGVSTELEVVAQNTVFVNNAELIYTKTGQFTAQLEGEVDVATLLATSIQQVLSVENAANTEVRSLLEAVDVTADGPDLTVEQTDRLIDILNTNGANLIRNPDTDELGAESFVRYTFNVTSTLAERADGLVSGTYGLESRIEEIVYEIQTFSDQEGNNFQFFIPVVTFLNIDLEITEQGVFVLELVNEIGF